MEAKKLADRSSKEARTGGIEVSIARQVVLMMRCGKEISFHLSEDAATALVTRFDSNSCQTICIGLDDGNLHLRACDIEYIIVRDKGQTDMHVLKEAAK
jgi:hypothetical protein